MGILSVLFSVEALILLLTLVVVAYIRLTWNFGYWKKKGVFQLDAAPFYGSVKDRLLFKTSISDMDRILYEKMAGHKFGSYIEGRDPFLLVRDPDIIKDILVKNFDHFINRRTIDIFASDPAVGKMLSILHDQEWKNTRALMTPAFTSGKLKKMTNLISDCAEQMTEALEESAKDGHSLEAKELFTRFTLDVIATTAFGLETNCIKDPNNEFYKMSIKFVNFPKLKTAIMFTILTISIKLFNLFKLSLFPRDALAFFWGVIRSTVAYREEKGERRNDFLQLMIDAKNGYLEKDDLNNAKNNSQSAPNVKAVLTEDVMFGQCLIFFFGGLEPVATLMSLAAYELALATDIQEKLQKEIDEILENHEGKCTYDAIQEMPYLDMVIQETLRKNPPTSRVERCCNKRYQIPGTNVTLEPGDYVMMSVNGQHYDEKYFPEPNKFDPERFSPENVAKRNPYVYMPFGHGPRNCIGNRFALIDVKIGLASLLHRYSMIMDEKTQVPYQIDPLQFGFRTKSGIWLKFSERKH